ncbi:hypothetical protein [Psychrobacter sp. Ps2]|uniref:leucine-rich repeat domain-containing protein n=1 Tax=Psychrobacter sp. Ps2 TaxID=2790956 RepID=UPI001EDD097F|nr:hypothetical protein [Psychrobacter sp. Ps2]MCG3858074.1 hypothetical protein [Psychrobacter sp. Ps2]
MTTNSIREYLAKRELLDEQVIVTEDNEYVDLDTMDKEALQQVIDWAKSCDISEYTVSHNIQQLANQESLDIQAYTHALPKALGSLTQLKSLSLRNTESLPNGVEDRLPESIGDLINLKELILDYENYAFNFESLNKLKNLKHLEISFYDAHRLPDVLEELDCDISLRLRNEQGRMPTNLSSIGNVVDLVITDDKLTTLPKSFSKLISLKEAYLYCKNLTQLPMSLGSLANLRDLNITSDNLNELPERIGKLTHLNYLQLNCQNLNTLPESIVNMNKLEELVIYSDQLKEIARAIGNLASLTKLTLRCKNLESITESIGELAKLTQLIITSDKLDHLPKSVDNLTKLRHLELNRELTTKIPKNLIDRFRNGDLYLSGVPAAALYQPNMDDFPLSIIGCFIISDGWDQQALLKLKERIGAYFLVGLQTDDSESERLDVIEGVVKCQPDEVNDVVELLDVNSASTIIGIDVVDVKSLFECGNFFQFIQVSATGEPESDLIKVATHKLVSQLAKAHDTKGLFIGMESVQSLPLEDFAYVADAVEELLSDDDTSIYYSSSIANEPDYFRLRAIYAEEKQSHT